MTILKKTRLLRWLIKQIQPTPTHRTDTPHIVKPVHHFWHQKYAYINLQQAFDWLYQQGSNNRNNNDFREYPRYMDDWVQVYTKKHHWCKATKQQYAILQALRVEIYPDKTFIRQGSPKRWTGSKPAWWFGCGLFAISLNAYSEVVHQNNDSAATIEEEISGPNRFQNLRFRAIPGAYSDAGTKTLSNNGALFACGWGLGGGAAAPIGSQIDETRTANQYTYTTTQHATGGLNTYCLIRDKKGNYWSVKRAGTSDLDIKSCASTDTFNPSSGCEGETTSNLSAVQRFGSAAKSTAAGFMDAGSNAQQFMVQHQIQNRLVNRLISRNGQTALSGFADKESLQEMSARQAIANTYSAGIHRPSRTTWHSKDGLIGKLFGAGSRDKEQQKRESENNSIDRLDYSNSVSGGTYEGLTAKNRQTSSSPSSLRFDNAPYDIWASAGYTNVDSSETGNNYDGDYWFGRVGIDHLYKPNLLLGAFAGYDAGDADFSSLSTDVDTEAEVIGAYFGYLMTPETTNLPVHLVLDGQASYSSVEYDLRETDTGTTANFNADRWMATFSLTAVINKYREDSDRPIRWLPKVGISYSEESQGSYTDSANTAHPGQDFSLGQLTFGTQVLVPIFEDRSNNAEFFAKLEGLWDFDDVGQTQRSDGTYYRPDNFGASAGMGIRFNIGKTTTLRIEGSNDSIGRESYDQWSGLVRVDHSFH